MSRRSGTGGELPPAGTVVRVDVGDGGVLVPVGCVVVAVEGDELLLEVTGRVERLAARRGASALVHWSAERGRYEVAGALTAVGQRWRLRVRGEPELIQRRRYVRAAVQAPVAVVPGADATRRVVGGWLVDLGEGGARAHLELDEGLEPGTVVEVHLTLEDTPVAFTGTVLRITDPRGLRAIGTATARLVEVVVAFDEPVDHAARIRRSVLREQARARRSAVAGAP